MLKPWSWIPAQMAHDLAPLGLKLTAAVWGQSQVPRWQTRHWRGLEFPNPVGVAGGVDKTALSLSSWWKLGAGFIELGTVTPLPQGPNDGPILARDWQQKFLWNRMGFPSPGADVIAQRLGCLERPYPSPLFINVGKNRETELARAARDYVVCMEKLERFADAFVLNISSPNTSGLRELQSSQYLEDFLAEILQGRENAKPVLAKLSPDLSPKELETLIEVGQKMKLAGFILTNTTLDRPSPDRFPAQGGFSGSRVKAKSLALLQQVVQQLGSQKASMLLVSVGGISSVSDIHERLSLGADLVQVYSALVFEGPMYFRSLARQMQS